MTGIGFDHLVLTSKDLAAQAAFYEQLGFTLTPRAQHPWGTTNHLAQMQGVFLELLGLPETSGVTEHTPNGFSFSAFIRDVLARRGDGMSMLVFQTSDAAGQRRIWQDRGLRTWDLFEFRRQAPQPDGTSVPVAFTLAFATPPDSQDSAFFVCQQHYPENFWRPRFQRHANGAQRVPMVWMVARDPADHAGFFTRLAGEGTTRLQDDRLVVACRDSSLEILSPAAYARQFPGLNWPDDGRELRFAGYTIAVDVGQTRQRLTQGGIAHREERAAIRIDPAAAFGSVVVLVPA